MAADFVQILRSENQRLRIERVGFLSRIEELQAEIERLKAEAFELRAAMRGAAQAIGSAANTTANG
jgi:hypothetical protein